MTSPQKISLTDFFLGELEMALNDNSFLMSWYIDLRENKVTFISESFEADEELVERIERDTEGERFIDQLKDEKAQQILYKSIDGRGAFSRFKNNLFELNMEDEWHEFKGREDRKNALNWLFGKGLIAEKEIEKGMQMYEDTVARRKRREANLAKMKKGAVVICSDNAGHINQITPGQTYEVLDEQKEHLNLRIKDDRGKIIWLPKSHFELVSEP